MIERAYTEVDHVSACVGNRWIRREWSRFFGSTTSLRHETPKTEWVQAENPEFCVELEHLHLGVMDFGEVEWSEEFDTFGATLVATRARPGIRIVLRTTAFHDHPAMLRIFVIANTGADALHVRRISVEAVRLGAPGWDIWTTRGSDPMAVDADTVTVMLKERGIAFGSRTVGIPALGEGSVASLAIRVPVLAPVGPGRQIEVDSTYLIPFQGNPEVEVRTGIDTLQRLLNKRANLPDGLP